MVRLLPLIDLALFCLFLYFIFRLVIWIEKKVNPNKKKEGEEVGREADSFRACSCRRRISKDFVVYFERIQESRHCNDA